MSLMTLIQKIAGKQRERQFERHAAYRELVHAVAAGREPDADVVADVLRDTGKTLDDLQADVLLLERRREMRQKMDALPKLAAERKRIEMKIAEADRVLDVAEQQHEQETSPLHFRLEEIKKAVREGDSAQRQLVDTCNDPTLLAEYQSVTDGLREATGRRTALEKKLRDLQQWAASDRTEIPRAKTEYRAVELKERAEQRETQAAALESELVEVRERISVLEKRATDVRRRMLVP